MTMFLVAPPNASWRLLVAGPTSPAWVESPVSTNQKGMAGRGFEESEPMGFLPRDQFQQLDLHQATATPHRFYMSTSSMRLYHKRIFKYEVFYVFSILYSILAQLNISPRHKCVFSICCVVEFVLFIGELWVTNREKMSCGNVSSISLSVLF